MAAMIKRFPLGALGSNIYLLRSPEGREAVLIDSGGGSLEIEKVLRRAGLSPEAILITHGHWDHTLELDEMRRLTGAPAYMHPSDLQILEASWRSGLRPLAASAPIPSLDGWLRDGQEFSVGEVVVKVLHTPGHTPGGVCFFAPSLKAVFTGDTLFAGGVGRTDLLGGDAEHLAKSIQEKLFSLGDDVVVYPGHGGQTTIGFERAGARYFPL